MPRWSGLLPSRRRALTWGPVVVATAALSIIAIRGVYARVGHPAAALDDAYIHFQYARAIAEGHPMRYQAGEPVSSGATSFLWPALLAPFWLFGLRDVSLMWGAWILSFVAWGALAWEGYRITLPLGGRAAAIGAGASMLAFGGLAWCAASGMEVVPFAWLFARSVRRASEWAEGGSVDLESPSSPKRMPKLAELVALGIATPLMRPEGAIASMILSCATVAFPTDKSLRGRARGLLPLLGVIATPLLLRVTTGSATSSTAQVKLLWGNPYYAGRAFWDACEHNARVLVGTLLNGEVWSAEFLPKGAAPFAFAGLVAIVACGWRTGRAWRAAFVLVWALAIFVPCTYVTFLWNRLRYLWPFSPGWLIGGACLAAVLGELASSIRPRWRGVTPIACGVVVGMLASKLEWTLQDVADSASGIDRQQVKLGRWARSLPPDARIGVNDTGAIAYMSDRRTFDVVGLTTATEGRYWVAGSASRFEHYERLGKARLPTHFIVYPEWMGCEPLLGQPLQEAVVTDSTILGGQIMRAYVADWSKLGSGDAPWTTFGSIVDALDVADLESEAEHAYELLGAKEGEQTASEGQAPDGRTLVDGGRTNRARDKFVAHLREGGDAQGLVRIEAGASTRVDVLVGGESIGSFVADSTWSEKPFAIPARLAHAKTDVELRANGAALTTFHYWFSQ